MNSATLVRSYGVVLIFVAIVAALLTTHQAAFGADPNGFPICTAMGDQTLPVVVPDGAGGVIIAWHDRRPTVALAGVCFAQRVNAQGVPQWTAGGLQLFTTGDGNPPVIAVDGAGGAYVAFGGDGSQSRVQWVNAAGVVQWGADGTPLTSASSSQRDLAITRDVGGAGGAIVAWREVNGTGGTSDIHAQKVNAAGVIQWAANGTPVVASNMNSETLPALVSDGSGGAFFIWLGSNGARAQRLNSTGVGQWNATPLAATANNRVPAIAPDGAGGMVAAWAGGGATYAQRVDGSGNKLWNPPNTGVQLSTAGNQITMIPDGAGGGIFVWQDNRGGSNFNLFAQKLDGSGAPQWLATGAEVCVFSGEQLGPMIVSDGGTGAIITWYDQRSGMTEADIYAQRIDATSARQWMTDGNPVSVVANAQEFPTIASDAAGGAFIVWEDFRNGSNEDIYASHVGPGGVVVAVPIDGGGSTPSIAGPWPHPFTDRVSFTLALPGPMQVGLDVFDVNGRRVRSLGSRALPAGMHSFTWDGRQDDGGSATSGIYFVRAVGEGLSVIRSVVRLR